jgi:spore germination protein YaaH
MIKSFSFRLTRTKAGQNLKRWTLTLLSLAALASFAANAAETTPVALFYLTDNPNSVRSFLAHYKQIGLLVPTWYSVDENGLVTGEPDPTVLDIAHNDKLPVMPIVALFNKKAFHAFAGNHDAWTRMNEALVRECKQHGYTGFQFDFEDIDYTDGPALTAIVQSTAAALHQAGLQLSIATVPNYPGYPAGKNGFAKWIYTDWRGAFDIAELAKSVDLLCLMTYDQNTRWTMPGPVAGWQWTVDNLDYALKVVPKEKLSLGIPLYGYHWYTGAPKIDKNTGEEQPNQQGDYIDAVDVDLLAKAYKAKVEWDPVDHTAWFWFYRDQMREWIFYTDLHTFQDRYELVKQRGLEGFCSWVLGAEDPEIWKYLPQAR